MIPRPLQDHMARGERHHGDPSVTRRVCEALGAVFGPAQGDRHLTLDEHRGLRAGIAQSRRFGCLRRDHLPVITHADHAPVARFYTPQEFESRRDEGMRMGFRHVAAGPLVRSSYHADEQYEAATTVAV